MRKNARRLFDSDLFSQLASGFRPREIYTVSWYKMSKVNCATIELEGYICSSVDNNRHLNALDSKG